MNGIIIVDKPKGYTSRDVINVLNKKFGTKKIGHTGTLDPIATGVLVVCLGKSLKLSELLTSYSKEYVAKVKLGIETDTLDITGNVVNSCDNFNFKKEEIEEVLNKFKGKIKQEVPKYSAVSVNGKRLYEYARNNIEVLVPTREVEVEEIELVSDVVEGEFSFRCVVSKGTYIRSLIRDIGRFLGTFATMTDLMRTKQGQFGIDKAYTLEDIDDDNYEVINPVDVLEIPKVIVNDKMAFKIKNGQVLKKFFDADMAMILNEDNELLAIYRTKDSMYVKPYKMF